MRNEINVNDGESVESSAHVPRIPPGSASSSACAQQRRQRVVAGIESIPGHCFNGQGHKSFHSVTKDGSSSLDGGARSNGRLLLHGLLHGPLGNDQYDSPLFLRLDPQLVVSHYSIRQFTNIGNSLPFVPRLATHPRHSIM